jgi:hypothetical protein
MYRQNRFISHGFTPWRLLMVRHFAERDAPILGLTSFPFNGFRMANRLHSSLAPVVETEE